MSTISCDIRSVEAARAVGRIAEPEPAFVTRFRLRAQHRVLWLRKLWAAGDDEARGLAIAHDEVDRILADPASLARAEQTFEEQDAGACALASLIRAADLATEADPILWQLRRELHLGDRELDLLTLAAAIEAAPPMRRLYGYIHDDATAGFATQWLAQQLFRWPSGTQVGADSNLWRWRMVRPADARTNPWSITSPWEVDAHVARCLLQGISVDARLGSAVRLIPPDVPGPATCLYPGVLATMTSFVRAMAARDTLEIVVAGAPGAGRCTLAIQLCRELQVPLLVADARALLAPGHEAAAIAESLLQVTRSARLLHAAVYWQDADGAGAAASTDPGEHPALSIFGTAGAQPATRGIRHPARGAPVAAHPRRARGALVHLLPRASAGSRPRLAAAAARHLARGSGGAGRTRRGDRSLPPDASGGRVLPGRTHSPPVRARIKSAAMAAAFLARNEGRRIGMAHVLHAARRELAKRGMTLRATLGE
jgi:hypothetical protein